jgi:16S rRNA (cytosine967-C5)-methyltransferase
MRYIWQHIKDILEQYKGDVPLAHFLKNYFRRFPKLGSRDRKTLTAMAYSWYRCEKGIEGMPADIGAETGFKQKIKLCLRLAGNEALANSFENDGQVVPALPFNIQTLFPFEIALSAGITRDEWLHSMVEQPRLFIRIRKNKELVSQVLKEHNIPFEFITPTCLSLPNGSKIDQLLQPDIYAVQDASSQQTAAFFIPKKNQEWYDCCAGAGGKSLQLKDLEPSVRITVSDKRKSILHNMLERFSLYHLQAPVAHVLDVSNLVALESTLDNAQFDNIICDVPCSGSGTWARTPEQLYFFTASSLEKFAPLQEIIAANVARHLKKDGRLFYITCSVFKEENEDVVERVIQKTGLTLVQSQLINGIGVRADSMFIAVLKK